MINNTLPKELKGKKVSEVFKEYAEPYLDIYLQGHGEVNLAELEYILRVPWLVWNAVVMKNHPKNNIDYMASINLLLKNKSIEMKKLINALQERKELMFKQYDYLFGKFKLTIDQQSNEIKLYVEAKLLS